MAEAKKAPAKKPASKAAAPAAKKAVAKAAVDPRDAKLGAFLDSARKSNILGDLDIDVELTSTGAILLDRALGDGDGNCSPGGFPKGAIIEIFGSAGAGKTTIALMHAIEVQKKGGKVLFMDFEHVLRLQTKYLRRLGVNLDKSKFILIEPENYEDGVAMMGRAILQFQPDLIIMDSLAAATPKAVAQGEVGELAQVGIVARVTGTFLSAIGKMLKKGPTTLLILNQLRAKISTGGPSYGPKEESPGGNAIKFYPAQRVELKMIGKEKAEGTNEATGASEEKVINTKIKATIMKNKVDKPFVSVELYINFGEGFDNVRSVMDMAINRGIVLKSGAWLKYESQTNKELSFNLQGIQTAYQHIKANPALLADINKSITMTIDAAEINSALQRGILDDETAKAVSENLTTPIDDQESLAALEALDSLGGDGGMLDITSLDELDSLG